MKSALLWLELYVDVLYIKGMGFLYIPGSLETSLRDTNFLCLFSKNQGKHFFGR